MSNLDRIAFAILRWSMFITSIGSIFGVILLFATFNDQQWHWFRLALMFSNGGQMAVALTYFLVNKYLN